MPAPSVPGIYVAALHRDELVPVTQDSRYVKTCAQVNSLNVKVGKARNLAARERDYWNDFGDNVVFLPIARTTHIQDAETAMLRELAQFRKLSPKDGPMDWLENITKEQVIELIFLALRRANIPHERLCDSAGILLPP
jgi:hypothetical protein